MTKSKLSSQHLLEKSERLARVVRKSGLKQADIAEQVGCTPQTINKLVRGYQNLSADWARRLSTILGVTPDYLLMDTDELPSGFIKYDDVEISKKTTRCIAIPTLSVPAGAGGGKILDAEPCVWKDETYFDEKFILGNLKVSADNLCVVTIEGQSMEPVLNNGDTVLVNMLKNNVNEPGIFVLFDGEGIVCKWVERLVGSEPAKYRIKSENNRFSEYVILADEAKIIGRVVWFGRTL